MYTFEIILQNGVRYEGECRFPHKTYLMYTTKTAAIKKAIFTVKNDFDFLEEEKEPKTFDTELKSKIMKMTQKELINFQKELKNAG